MASKIKVDQIEGAAGSSITIPSGQTLTITDGLAASTIGSGTLADARIPNLNASKINAGTLADAQIPNLNASKINAGTIPVARGGTGLTSLGSAGQVVQVNSGASALEFAAASSGKLIGMEKVYFSDSVVSFSNEGGTQLTGNTYYPNSAKISGTYNKQQSNSHILQIVRYSLGHSTDNLHGMVAWVTGKESSYRNTGNDARTFGWYDHGSIGAFTSTMTIWWNGASSSEVQGTGNKTFNFVGAVSGTRTHGHSLNFNPHSGNSAQGANNSDTPDRNTHSEIIIMEYEA
jgi:hypothetical protein